MGCWNKTCGLSNLHIRDSEDVYVFVLRQNSSEGRCYNTSFYSPSLVPFECQYNDYGNGTNNKGIALQPLMDTIREILIEQPLGENTYHDIKVAPENFDIDLFFDAVHEGRLVTKDDYTQKEVLLDFVMMRKDIVHSILDNWPQEIWMNGKYEIYYYANVIADIPFFIQDVSNYIEARRSDPVLLEMYLKILERFEDITSNGISIPGINLVSLNINRNSDYHKIFNPNKYLVQLIKDKKFEEANLFLVEYMKGVFINRLIDKTRRQWIPGCHEGSQSADLDGYIALNNAISDRIEIEEHEYDELEEI
jgi:hypothetical protein